MSGGETPLRSFRAGEEWDEAQRIAKAKGDNLSIILRDRLREYIEDNQEGQRDIRAAAWDEGLRKGWEGEIPDHLWTLNPYRSNK